MRLPRFTTVALEARTASGKEVLATLKEELGLPNRAGLSAELHSLLVYEPNQFFLAHQDSEKDDAMVGTLVVTLPSSYAGGELMVGHNEEWRARDETDLEWLTAWWTTPPRRRGG